MVSFYVETRNLTKKYRNLVAVDRLNLRIKKGEIYGLVGPNGAGKTTTIKILCGILRATSGEAYILGRRLPDKRVMERIGYMPQETALYRGLKRVMERIGYMPQETALYRGLTVKQNIEFFGSLYGLEREMLREKVEVLLKFVELEERGDEKVMNLSGGMMRRVSLVCSLVHEPDILFLDEPTVGVDPELRASFWGYFNRLRERGKTILITTHYMDEATRCHRVGFMREGRLIAEDTPEVLLERAGKATLEEAFLVLSEGGGSP